MPYPLISLVNRLPQTLQGLSQINFHTRTFESFSLSFKRDSDASDVFESVKELTVASKCAFIIWWTLPEQRVASVSNLYAFFYNPTPPFVQNDGWSLYSPRDEYVRMGVGTRSKAWRFTDLNKDYSVCLSFPFLSDVSLIHYLLSSAQPIPLVSLCLQGSAIPLCSMRLNTAASAGFLFWVTFTGLTLYATILTLMSHC